MKSATETRDLAIGRPSTTGFIFIAAALAGLLMLGRQQTLTGDEPRYLIYAVSILKHGTFVMSLPDWQRLYLSITGATATSLPEPAGGTVLMHGVYLPALLSPIAALFALSGLRAATLAAGLVGLFYLLKLCRRIASAGPALLATSVAGFSIPLLPYLHLFYMETFLFALVCCAWERLQKNDRRMLGDLITAAVILTIPFVHMRGSVVGAALYAFLLYQLVSRGRRTQAVVLLFASMLALVILVGLNQHIYGAITGPVNTARPPVPSQWFAVISMQLFNVRHGLIAYAPVWLLGYAGLWAGAAKRVGVAWQGLVLATIAALTGVGISPGECWPARFWVLSIPMLSVGLCVALEYGRSTLLRIVAAALMCATLVNTAVFVWSPNAFLENRQSATTYQRIYDKIGYFNVGLILPVEVPDASDAQAARDLAVGAALIVILLTLAVARNRSAYAVVAAILMMMALDLSRVRVMPGNDYTVASTADKISLNFSEPIPAAYVQFGNDWETWSTPPSWQTFSTFITGADGAEVSALLSADQVIAASCESGIKSITIRSSGPVNIGLQAKDRFAVYRSRSLLRNGFAALRKPC